MTVRLTTLHTEVTDLLVVRVRGKLHRAGQQQGQPEEKCLLTKFPLQVTSQQVKVKVF